MNTDREAVMAALQSLLSCVSFKALSGGETTWADLGDGLKVGRRLKLWTDVPMQPACFVTVHSEEDSYTSSLQPPKTLIEATIFVYFRTGDASSVPATDLNYILRGIDVAIGYSPVTGRQTLGGLVEYCRRFGKIMLDPGDMDGQGLAIIPIQILVP